MEKPRQTQAAQVSVVPPPPPQASENPVKLAVALGYVPESERAPRVLAGGRGAIAEQILNIAFAQGVRVREDADLVQLLASLDIDSEIPADAFAAVAEILVYVYRANGASIETEATGPDEVVAEQFLAERAIRPAG